jgi:hypothetical protein
MSIFVACVHPGSQSPPETGFYREKFSKKMDIGEVDMLWSVVAPEGDYFYLGGTIERQYKNEPSSLVFHKVTKVDGRIVMTEEERQKTKGMANVYGLAADGAQLFASGYQPDKAGNQGAFIAKLNSGLDYIDFKKISLHPDFGIFVLDKETLALKTKYNSGLSHYNQPWGLEKKGDWLLIAGFTSDLEDACFQGGCGNWYIEVWRIKPGCQLACPNFIQTKRFHLHSRAASQGSARARK